MGHHLITEVAQEKYTFNGKSKLIAIILIVLGIALAGFGSMQVKENWGGAHDTEAVSHDDATAHEAEQAHGEEASHGEEAAASHGHEKSWTSRLWANLLMNSYYFLLFAVGALFFIAVNYVANAGWATMIKRISEAITAYVGIGIVALVAVVYMAKDQLYHWLEYFSHGYTSADAGYDRILESKSWFLNSNILFIVFPIVLVVWYFFRWKFRSNSIKEDAQGGLSFFRNSTRWSAAFIFIFAFTFSAIAWLIIMSIDAHWYSTMFSVYNFAVSFVTGLTVMMMFLLYLKSKGYMEMVSDEVVHDLGKFMFAFSIFWGYIFLGQWLLIWYANIPEEVVYFNARFQDGYTTLFYVNIIMCFVLPFLILMMRNAKRSPLVLTVAGSIILVGHWIDMYLMVMPGTVGKNGGIGLLEIGTTMAFAGVFIYVVLYSLSKANLYTTNHPYFLESANHDVGP
ncbi:MAG: quinol:cytochrome C oxidoreductase [Bacteroidia bacterium]